LRETLLVQLHRRAGQDHPAAALAALIAACCAHDPPVDFRFLVEDGRVSEIDPNEEFLRAHFAGIEDAFVRKAMGMLTLAAVDDQFGLVYFRDHLGGGVATDTITLRMRWGDAGERAPAWATPMGIGEFVAAGALAYEARVTTVAPNDLLTLAALPNRDPHPSSGRVVETAAEFDAFPLGREVVETFLDMVPSVLFDHTLLPATVGWINVWCREVVATLGRGRVLSAPWHHVIELDSGHLLGIASEEAPGRNYTAGLERIAAIIRAIDLAETQEHHAHTGSSG
jgi:hypothetical protein